jgi:hypothetical protein
VTRILCNEYPQPGKLVRKETYVAEYASLVEAEGVPFVPKAIGKDLLFSALPMVGILVCSTVFGPSDPSGPPDPTQINTAPRKGRTPLELQGALMLQHKQCRNCHSLGGSGGKRGPALDGVATRRTREQLIRQVLQGGGNMPAYGKNLELSQLPWTGTFLARAAHAWLS